MKRALWPIAVCLLLCAFGLAYTVKTAPYAQQHRDAIAEKPSARFPLGTDDLGRDRLARLLYGAALSLLLAPAAAFLSTVLAALAGGLAAQFGGPLDRLVTWAADVCLSVPWLFLLIAVRAMLPLNAAPVLSVVSTFVLLGVLGWANPARLVRVSAREAFGSDYVLHARALGLEGSKLFWRVIAPNLLPVLAAQFWISVPVYVLAETNLSLLGLGVGEPVPSLGGLLKELENFSAVKEQPAMLAPLFLLVSLLMGLQFALEKQRGLARAGVAR